MGSKSHWIHRTTLESPTSTISSGSKEKHHIRESMKLPAKPMEVNKLPEWNSHMNMQQLVKNRTKLKTPNSDESIEAYAKACRAKFNRKCAEKSDLVKRIVGKSRPRDQPIYTKPYSSDSYSDIQNIQRSNEDCMKGKQSDAYTSVTESDGFLSPNSISIGVAANSTSNTTTHQYDTKISVGLQTTNTLKRMPIIQLKKPADEPKAIEPVVQQQSTVRVNKLTINKQLQVWPEALAYIIIFKEDQDQNGNSNGQELGNQLYANTKKVNSINSIESSSDSNTIDGKNKRSDTIKEKTQFKSQISSNSSSIASFDNLTLQECLQTRRPDFYANAEQRRKCLNDLHNLR